MRKTDHNMLENEELLKASQYKIKYHPMGGSRELFHDRSPAICIAGPKGTGKSLSVLQKQHLVLSKYPGSFFFMARKTRASMTNSCLRTFQKEVLKPPDKVTFHKQDQQFNYPNGSVYAVIGLDNPDRLNSTNWDGGFIQECTECTLNDWEIASACIRFGIMPYKQLIGDCNPNGPTHWMKKLCDNGSVKMILSKHEDNPRLFNPYTNDWTVEGELYIKRLQLMTGVRLKRLYMGEWAAAEGMVYEEWNPDVHMLSYSDLPHDWTEWPQYWSIDFGFTHPFVWCMWVEDPKGRMYLVRQIYRTKQLVEDLAEEIMRLTEGLRPPHAIICDHDAEGRATFERHTGYLTVAAYKPIQEGVQCVQNRLKPNWEGKPGLFILRDSLVGSPDKELESMGRPTRVEEEWESYVWDDRLNKLVNSRRDELPVDKDNHGMDNCRYLCAFIDSLADDPHEEEFLMTNEDTVRISPY
jgi:phage terminase large subunit